MDKNPYLSSFKLKYSDNEIIFFLSDHHDRFHRVNHTLNFDLGFHFQLLKTVVCLFVSWFVCFIVCLLACFFFGLIFIIKQFDRKLTLSIYVVR